MISETRAACSRCGELHTITVRNSINVSENPELKQQVLDGSAFIWECPHCGTLNLIRSQVLYHDPAERLMVWMTGGSEELKSKVQASYGQMEELKDYSLRFVDDTGSLIEKVKIFDAGLDDAVMEMTKYVTKMEMCEKGGTDADTILATPFKFLNLNGADNEITLAYPSEGQMQMLAVGLNVYEDCRNIIARNPAVKDSIKGFATIDAEWVRRFFR